MGAPTSGWGTIAKVAGAGVSGAMAGREKKRERDAEKLRAKGLADIAEQRRSEADVSWLSRPEDERSEAERSLELGDFRRGGRVKRTGIYRLHKNERVLPARGKSRRRGRRRK